MMQKVTTVFHGAVLLAAVALICSPQLAAATKYVSNQGVDSPTCGASTDPCRSISQAIANSAGGGEGISVDAGVYGDANGNGLFGDPGDEAAEIASGCNCMIKVNKEVRIKGTRGTTVTVLDAAGMAISLVQIEASEARLEQFTLIGSPTTAVVVLGTTTDVVLKGNLAVATGSGFSVSGTSHLIENNRAVNTGGVGFSISGADHVVKKNVASANAGNGFDLLSCTDPELGKNIAQANAGIGFSVDSSTTGLFFKLNRVVGNRNHGLALAAGATVVLVDKSNFYGNGTTTIGPLNCGIFNGSAGIVADNSYWGASTGPGPDPADTTCGAVTVNSFKTTAINISPASIK